MTPQELADHWGVPLRTVQHDCKQRVYPMLYRTTNTSNDTHTGWYINDCIKHFSRRTWLNVHSKSPETYSPAEQAAYIMVNANDVSLADLSAILKIPTSEIRAIYSELVETGRVCVSHTTPNEGRHKDQPCENSSMTIDPCELRLNISAPLTRPYQTSLKGQAQKLRTLSTPSV